MINTMGGFCKKPWTLKTELFHILHTYYIIQCSFIILIPSVRIYHENSHEMNKKPLNENL